MGLYRYNSGVFDLLQIPSSVDKSILVNRILFTCYEWEIIFPDWDVMRYAIGEWSKARLDVWNRLASTLELTYDPIANYDRHEDWTDSGTARSSDTTSATSESNVSTRTTETANTDSNETQSTAGFNTDTPKVHETRSANIDAETVGSGTTDDTMTSSGTSASEGSSDSEHHGRVWGNIGVTSTQQLLTQEREVSEFNMYDYIAGDFAREFCLMVY